MPRYGKIAVAVVGLCWMLTVVSVAQTDQGSSKKPARHAVSQHGAGKHILQGVKVPFNPGLRDKDGKVIQATIPDIKEFEGEEDGPRMTQKAIADKAKAEAGEFSKLSKPLPRSVPLGKSNFLQRLPEGVSGPLQHRNIFKIAEGGPHAGTAPPAHFLGNTFPGVGDTGTEPPDVASAAGPVQIVAAANFLVNTFDKNGNLQGSQTFSDFFSPIGLGDPTIWFLFDPVVQYDPYIGRFWLVVDARNDTAKQSDLLIAVSRDSDLRSGWTLWWIDASKDGNSHTNNWCDYPHLGLDTHAIYLTCNQFQFGGGEQYAKIRIMLKDQFFNNTCCNWFDHWDMREGFLNLTSSYNFQPAMMRLAPDNSGEFLIDAEGQGGSGSTLDVWHIPDPVNNPGQLDVSDIDTSGYAPAPSARQPFGVTSIDTGDTRLLSATFEFGHISVAQNSNCGGSACAAFYEIDASNFPSVSLVNDWAFQASGVDYYEPAVDQNFNADKTMVYTRSSANEFAGSNYFGIPNSGACTLCFNGPETALAAGQNTYVRICCNNRNRWGDYFTASADPDGLGVWISGENVVAQNEWATEVAATYNAYTPFGQPSSNPLNFGNLSVSLTSGPVPEFVTNIGNATMQMGLISLTGDPNFSVVFDGCSGKPVQPNNSCEVDMQFSPTSLGVHNATFTAPYDNNIFQAQASVTGTGVKLGTFTIVSSSPNPSTFGQAVKISAVVVSQTTGTPTGKVTFKDGSRNLGTAPLNAGSASVTTTLAGGIRSLTATYGGDATFQGSTGATTQTVNPAATTTTFVSSQNPSTYGQTISFTASVSSSVSGTITGSVTFKDGATTLGTASLAAGKATLATAKLSAGTHSITAHYNGNADFASSTSAVLNQQVNKASTTTTLQSSANPAAHGTAVIFTATIKPAFGGNPTGTVTFKDGSTALGTAAVSASTHQAKITKSTLAVGTHNITAVYGGSTNYLTSTSAVLKQVIH